MIKISIIMPLYNAEKYLKESLQSIQRQTFTDYELICINDGSTDDTLSIIEEFQTCDDRIIILSNLERCGAAVSRNKGMEAARGQYITFLDGDDIFEEEMLETAYWVMEKQKPDIVMYEYKHVLSECIYEKQQRARDRLFLEKYCKRVFSVRQYEPIEMMNWSASPWNKLYRKSFIQANKLEFQTLSSSNDVYFVYMALMLAERIIMLDDRRIMVYARDHFEPSRISADRDPMCVYLAMEKIQRELIVRDKFEELSGHFYCCLFYSLRAALQKTKSNERAEKFYNFICEQGLQKLFLADTHKRYNQSPEIFKLLRSFQIKSYSAGWYKNQNVLMYRLNKERVRVMSLLWDYKKCNKRIAMWGVGINGSVLLDFLAQNHFRLDAIVDRDKRKQGQLSEGYIIGNPDEFLEDVQVIIVSAIFAYEDACKSAAEKGIEVIDIEELVG